MSRPSSSLLLLVLLALGLGWQVPSPASADVTGDPTADPAGAQYDAWAASLAKAPVLVVPGSDLSASERRSITRGVDEGVEPTYVLAVDGTDWTVTPEDVAAQLDARLGDDDPQRAVLVYSGDETLPAFGLVSEPDHGDPRAARVFVEGSAERDPSKRFTNLVQLVAAGQGDEALEGEMAEMWEDMGEGTTADRPDDDRDDPGWTRWVVVALGAALVGVFVLLRGRAVAGWWRRRRRAKRLEAYSGEARSTRDRVTAQRRLLALGEGIDAAEMRPHDDPQHWQSALDHYALAGRVADRRRDETDDVGVIVLCDLGQRHLASAHGAPFDSTPRCYVDPLHGPTVGWAVVDRTKTPVCERCLSTRADRRRPFLVDGKPWYRTGRAPWVGSGYGALVDLRVTVPSWLAKGD